VLPKGRAHGRLNAVHVDVQLILAAAHARIHSHRDIAKWDTGSEGVGYVLTCSQCGPPVRARIRSLQDWALDALDLFDRHDQDAGGAQRGSQRGKARICAAAKVHVQAWERDPCCFLAITQDCSTIQSASRWISAAAPEVAVMRARDDNIARIRARLKEGRTGVKGASPY